MGNLCCVGSKEVEDEEFSTSTSTLSLAPSLTPLSEKLPVSVCGVREKSPVRVCGVREKTEVKLVTEGPSGDMSELREFLYVFFKDAEFADDYFFGRRNNRLAPMIYSSPSKSSSRDLEDFTLDNPEDNIFPFGSVSLSDSPVKSSKSLPFGPADIPFKFHSYCFRRHPFESY
ncbi:hypothetical protein DMENIID0001_050020 [Sergentomyia squamirostris]